MSWLVLPVHGAGISRTGDLGADVKRLEALDRAAWLDLTFTDLGEAWWILHDARTTTPERFAHLALAVRIAGQRGYINTRRLDLRAGGVSRTVPADLFQSFSGGNYSILVSGAKAPRRPANPLAWRGFVWEGLEAPNTRLGDVFDDIAVMPRKRLRFGSSGPLRGAETAAVASPTSGDRPGVSNSTNTVESAEANRRGTPTQVVAPVNVSPVQNAGAVATPPMPPVSLKDARAKKPASEAPAPLPPLPPVPAHIPRRLDGHDKNRRTSRLPAHLEKDARTRHISQVNQTLRRRVAYLEALVVGPDLGRSVELDASVKQLLDVIMDGQKSPQRNVFLRIGTGVESKVGRIVNLTRYPLYKIASPRRGTHTILVDLEVRGPDGRTLLKSKGPGGGAASGPVQFRQIDENMTLRELGITGAVWWPIPPRLKRAVR